MSGKSDRWGLMSPGGPVPYGPVLQRTGALPFEKLIYRFQDLSAVGKGTRIQLGAPGEVALYSDFPVQVWLGDTDSSYDFTSEFRIVGDLPHIYVRKLGAAWQVGRLVIYRGSPVLGLNFQRESPDLRGIYTFDNFVFWNNLWTECQLFSMALPSAYCREAYYLAFVEIERMDGLVSGIEIREQESGGARILFADGPEDPSDLWFKSYKPMPRISADSDFYARGNAADGAGDNVFFKIGFVCI